MSKVNLNGVQLWIGVALVAYGYGGLTAVGITLIVSSLVTAALNAFIK